MLSAASDSLDGARVPRTDFYARRGKRLFDLAFASVFLLGVAIWLFPLIALAIRVESRGPAFFRQKRVGRNGVVFECLKFRTMRHDPDAPFRQASQNDCRVTRVGAFLRSHNCDELPQFINVWRGDMSVVGPRPHPLELDEIFKDRLPHYLERNVITPGVTGLAQISGRRGETKTLREMAHRVRLDRFYALRYSFPLDLRTIFATVWRSVQGDDNAY